MTIFQVFHRIQCVQKEGVTKGVTGLSDNWEGERLPNSRNRNAGRNMRQLINKAMHDSDEWVLKIAYRDKKGKVTQRFISPIRFAGRERMLALCLCRQEPRQFYLSRMDKVELAPASEVLMPMPLG